MYVRRFIILFPLVFIREPQICFSRERGSIIAYRQYCLVSWEKKRTTVLFGICRFTDSVES